MGARVQHRHTRPRDLSYVLALCLTLENPRKIVIWHDFDRRQIIHDLFESVEKPVLAR